MNIHEPSCLSMRYFRFAMTLTVMASLALLGGFLQTRVTDPVAARLSYLPTLEYIISLPCIACAGVLLLELVLNE